MECVACGKTAHAEMFGMAKSGKSIRFTPCKEADVLICKDADCVTRARERRLLEETFPGKKVESLYLEMAQFIRGNAGKLGGMIGLGVRSRLIITGKTAVMDALKTNQARLIVLNKKDGGDTRRKISALADAIGVPVIDYPEDKPFEQVVGKPNCQCAAVTDPLFAAKLRKVNQLKVSHGLE